jgi:hypothetical protein
MNITAKPLLYRIVLPCAASLLCGLTSWAHGLPKDFSAPAGHATGHVVKPDGMTWPPQPTGITDVRYLSQAPAEMARKQEIARRFDEIEMRAGKDARVRKALGGARTRLSVSDEVDKNGKRGASRYRYFDRASNTTQVVTREANGALSVSKIPATEYQPEIVDEEEQEAIALARSHFLGGGHARVQALKGFAILAYRPEGNGFFDGRVIYVSFHAKDDAAPEYVAWVDLSKQTVLRSRKEQ